MAQIETAPPLPGDSARPTPEGGAGQITVHLANYRYPVPAEPTVSVATDTAAESAASNGFGYFRINITPDGQELAFERVGNPFLVPHYGGELA